ncbi:MAG: UvrABC system protein C [Patescibacteria group bacterium]|nr:MAG: UvrABC system protein C [Patescibacteria group bacterium]
MNKKVVLKISKKLKESNLSKLPRNPGVYFFMSDKKEVLYVGKAKNLKNRISSYFSNLIVGKTKTMVEKSKYLSFIKTESEIEALILEANLIKKYKPKYNIIQKDDKSPLYILITKEKYPRLILGRKKDIQKKDLIGFYGPFLSTRTAKRILRSIRKFIPFSDHKIGRKPCMYSQINLCNPCPNFIESIDNKQENRLLFKKYLQNIKRVRLFLEGDIKRVERELNKEMESFIDKEDFENAKEIKERIESLRLLTKPLNKTDEYLENPNLLQDKIKIELNSLLEFLNNFFKIKKLKRIECYDVSHLSGILGTASMVVFIDGEKSSSDYRHFRLKESSNDDQKSLLEILNRRIKYLKDWGKPDLVIVDGGRPQLSAVWKVFFQNKIPVIGIAKKFEELVIPIFENNRIKYFKYKIKDKPFGNLIIRIRDETHRFALRYHRKLILNRPKL